MRFLHKFLRAVGFSQYTEKKQVQKLIRDIIIHADERSYTTVGKKTLVAEFDRNFAEDIGIAVCGEFDEDDTYSFDYYLPYLRSDLVSTAEDISIERHAAKESYAGICDDPKVGVSLIFYLQNMISYLKLQGEGKIPAKGTSLNLSALSCQGTIMMPIQKTEWQKKKIAKDAVQRNRLIQAARGGDEEAMESLTLEDMDTYTSISRKIQKADIFSLVDTYFMPYGVECDQYSVLGEITDMKLVTNGLTGEKVHILTLCCNDLNLKVAINSIDLLGEPAVGRRFKGSVWLQGQVNFPEES
ncbi:MULTISPECIES: DUF3881 family protein [Gallintestinimicrobium]|uniref:DUF3881 family protein n=1 Tax=Gallintestinimicrobium TaxID=2981633 RepID=UPI00280A5D7B|nr:DUF3881 family protein [Gallintestinimicrobium propionicum]MEE0255517.1 DUF3881 family protein [Lachnospiraceae bacterium]MEE1559769.1 DUF3881 family protein [Coprococcus comes]